MGTDSNDLHVAEGVEPVAAALASARELDDDESERISATAARKHRPKDLRHRVLVRRGRTPETVTAAEDGLLAAGAPLYSRGEVLTRLATGVESRGVRRSPRAPVLAQATSPMVLEEMERVCRFVAEKVNPDTGDVATRTVGCPAVVPIAYLSRIGMWRVPRIAAVAEAPILADDGSLRFDGCFDDVLVIATGDWPQLPKAPSEGDARVAVTMLSGLIDGYVFRTEVDRSVTLAAFLTAIARPTLRSAPAFGWSAPVRGSGKSKLADVTAILATGRPAPALAWAEKEEEAEKRIGAALIAADPVLLIDNIEHDVRSQILNSLLTQESVAVRLLGRSELKTIVARVLILLTGNNLGVVGDLTRRVLIAEIDAGCERPELRRFDFDPVEMARQNRFALVAACLTILKWGRTLPEQKKSPIGSFEAWSRAVRDPLLALGLADPCASLDRLAIDDPEREIALALLAAWFNAFGDASVTVAQAIKRAECESGGDLHDALLAVCGAGAAGFNSRRLGKYLRANLDRPFGDLVLRRGRGDLIVKVAGWRVQHHGALRLVA